MSSLANYVLAVGISRQTIHVRLRKRVAKMEHRKQVVNVFDTTGSRSYNTERYTTFACWS